MNKKVLILACILVVCLCALCFAACKGGKYEMKDFIVDFSELQDTYQQEDRVDLSLVKITATFFRRIVSTSFRISEAEGAIPSPWISATIFRSSSRAR